jgi:hypothetical protein
MMRLTLVSSLVLFAAGLFSARGLHAEGMGGEKVKPAGAAGSETFSLPLPSPDLPAGALTVKVVGSNMGDLKVDQPVMLERPGGQPADTRTARTGKDGRARFDGLDAKVEYVVAAEVGGTVHRSQPFLGPASGGLRLLLTLGAGASAPGASALPPSAQSPLPAGHPQIPASPGVMPEGHPPVGQDPVTPGTPEARPGEPEGGAAQIAPAGELASGQVLVRVVKGASKKPVAGAMVTVDRLGVFRTDAEGKLLVTLPGVLERAPASQPGAPHGQAPSHGPAVIMVRHDGLTYRSGRIRSPAAGGLTATFVVFDRTRDPSRLTLGTGSHWVCQIGESALNFMQVLNLSNQGDTVFDPGPEGLRLPLPQAARNAEVPEEYKQLLTVDREQNQLRVVAPLPPGSLPVRVFYEMPYQGADLDFRQKLPLSSGESVLVVVNSDRVRVLGPSVESAAAARASERKGLQIVLRPVKAGAFLELTLSDLPHRDRRDVYGALGLAGLLALWAVAAAWSAPRSARRREEQREQLLQQLVQLRRSKHRGDPASQRRKEILEELHRVWGEPR